MTIWVGNIRYDCTGPEGEAALRELFQPYGEIMRVSIPNSVTPGRNRGFGFVVFALDSDAERAMKELNGTGFQGRRLVLHEAQRPRWDDPAERCRRRI
jgi:RNA recognition motif-containing protein